MESIMPKRNRDPDIPSGGAAWASRDGPTGDHGCYFRLNFDGEIRDRLVTEGDTHGANHFVCVCCVQLDFKLCGGIFGIGMESEIRLCRKQLIV